MAKGKGKGNNFDRWLVAGIVLVLVLIGLFLWGPLHKYRPTEEKKPTEQAKKIPPEHRKQTLPERPERKETRKQEPSGQPAEKSVRIAIVIDDLGPDMKPAQEILSLHDNITFAIMPGQPKSRMIASLARQNNREVLIHLPMEPKNKNGKPIPRGTLRSDMTPMEFMTTLTEDVESVPGAIGVNNHEGSALTENKEAMKFLMAELKVRELLFLDSRTNPKTVAYSTAKEFGIKAAKRDVFLDNEGDNPAYIHGQLEELVRIAQKHGSAIAIGHPHPATISELRKWFATLDEATIEIVPVSKLMQ